jgi:ribosome-associated protein
MGGRKKPGYSAPTPDSPLDDAGNPIWAGPSRSQKRRDASAVSDLALHLVQLPNKRVAALGLDEELRDAIEVCARLNKGARARQLRLVAKLLRGLPLEELTALAERAEAPLPARTSAPDEP